MPQLTKEDWERIYQELKLPKDFRYYSFSFQLKVIYKLVYPFIFEIEQNKEYRNIKESPNFTALFEYVNFKIGMYLEDLKVKVYHNSGTHSQKDVEFFTEEIDRILLLWTVCIRDFSKFKQVLQLISHYKIN